MTSINCEELDDEEAMDILKNDFGSNIIEDRKDVIMSPQDVLYYADIYADIESAILLQGWDKSLPKLVHDSLLNSKLDIYDAVNTHKIETEKCPYCASDMYPFKIPTSNGHSNTEWIDELGNITDVRTEIVSNKDGIFWNADPSENDAPVLCPVCSTDRTYEFPQSPSDSGCVRVHYGGFDEISGFSVSNNLVRFDFVSYMGDNMTDLWALPGGEQGLPKSLATNSLTDWLDEHNWTKITLNTVKNHKPDLAHRMKLKQCYKQIAQDWAESDETHPDVNFTVVVKSSKYNPSFLVAKENEDKLVTEIAELIEYNIQY
jgi:hypothetical protein